MATIFASLTALVARPPARSALPCESNGCSVTLQSACAALYFSSASSAPWLHRGTKPAVPAESPTEKTDLQSHPLEASACFASVLFHPPAQLATSPTWRHRRAPVQVSASRLEPSSIHRLG